MRKIILFWRMPIQSQLLFMLNFFLCGIARAIIKVMPFRRLTPYFGQFQKITMLSIIAPKKQYNQALFIGRSVRLAAKYTPWNSSCLTQAMIAAFWCRRFHIPYVFYIGFAKSVDEPSGYKAHAWVSVGPIAITGGNGSASFQVVSSYIYFV